MSSVDERLGAVEAEIAACIRAARDGRGMTQLELAGRLGLTRASIANIEANRQRLAASQLVLISEALDTSVSALCGQAVDRSLAVAITGLQRRLAAVIDGTVADLERANRELNRVTAIIGARPGPTS